MYVMWKAVLPETSLIQAQVLKRWKSNFSSFIRPVCFTLDAGNFVFSISGNFSFIYSNLYWNSSSYRWIKQSFKLARKIYDCWSTFLYFIVLRFLLYQLVIIHKKSFLRKKWFIIIYKDIMRNISFKLPKTFYSFEGMVYSLYKQFMSIFVYDSQIIYLKNNYFIEKNILPIYESTVSLNNYCIIMIYYGILFVKM